MNNDQIQSSKTPVVILTAGSEMISVSLAETFRNYRIPLIVIALGLKSIIRDLPEVQYYYELDWPPSDPQRVVDQLLDFFCHRNLPYPLMCFTTEDGGARLTIDYREQLAKYLVIPGGRKLKRNGYDKAELFQFLIDHQQDDCIPTTVILEKPEDLYRAVDALGKEIIVKPSVKPFSMKADIERKGQKILSLCQEDSLAETCKTLNKYWSISKTWVAQKKLSNYAEKGEALWWGLRSKDGRIYQINAFERIKYPSSGGTGSWVETSQNIDSLNQKAKKILETIDYWGLAEIPFLLDEKQEWKMLELNVRAWIQVRLPDFVNFPVAYLTYLDALGFFDETHVAIEHGDEPRDWVQIERLLLSALTADNASRFHKLKKVINIIKKSDYRIIYDAPFPHIKKRWFFERFKRFCKRK